MEDELCEEIEKLREVIRLQAEIIESQGMVGDILADLAWGEVPWDEPEDNHTTGTTTAAMGIQGKDWDYTTSGRHAG